MEYLNLKTIRKDETITVDNTLYKVMAGKV